MKYILALILGIACVACEPRFCIEWDSIPATLDRCIEGHQITYHCMKRNFMPDDDGNYHSYPGICIDYVCDKYSYCKSCIKWRKASDPDFPKEQLIPPDGACRS